MTIYRASITTAGLTASRLYELSKAEEKEPRTATLIKAGYLIKQPTEHPAVHAMSPAAEGAVKVESEKTDKHGGADPPSNKSVRTGVPEIPA